MAENRYNVDDILREVKEKRAREERAAQPEKRATTTTEDLLRQLDAAQTGLSRAAGPASERPAPAKTAPQPVKKAEPFPGSCCKRRKPRRHRPQRPNRNLSGRSRSGQNR